MAGLMDRTRGSLLALVAATLLAVVVAAQSATAATLYAPLRTGTNANSVAQFHIGAGGRLEPLNPATIGAGQRPEGVAANGSSVYVTNVNSAQIAQYDISASGALSAKSPHLVPVDDILSPGIGISSDGTDVYAAGAKTGETFSRIFQFNANPATGALSPMTPGFVSAVSPSNLVVHPLSLFHTSESSGGQVRRFVYNADGTLGSFSGSAAAAGIDNLAVTPDGKFLYAQAPGNVGLYGFSINQSTGALTALSGGASYSTQSVSLGPPGTPLQGNAQSVAATNTSVYVTVNDSPDRIAMFDINPTTGELTPKSPDSVATGTAAQPVGMVVSPDESSLYAANATTADSIVQFDIGPGGLLSLKSPSTVQAGGNAVVLAVSASGDGSSTPPPGPQPTAPPPPPPPPPSPPIYKYVALKKDGKIVVIGLDANWEGPAGQTPYITVGECAVPPPATPTRCTGDFTIMTSKVNPVGVDIVKPDGTPIERVNQKPANTILMRGSFSIPKGKKVNVRLKPTGAGKALLAKGGQFKVWFVTKLRNGSDPIAYAQKLKIRVPKRD